MARTVVACRAGWASSGQLAAPAEWGLEMSLERPLRTLIRRAFKPKSPAARRTTIVLARHGRAGSSKFKLSIAAPAEWGLEMSLERPLRTLIR